MHDEDVDGRVKPGHDGGGYGAPVNNGKKADILGSFPVSSLYP
jgi:hypothetical protein